MNTQKITMLLLAGVLAAGIGVCAAPSLSAQAEDTVSVSHENASLFLPEEYEQYLSLSAPTDAAFTDDYIAIADGETVYVYVRAENKYLSYRHDTAVSTLQFTSDKRLFFLDGKHLLYSLDPTDMTAVSLSCDGKPATGSTFFISEDVLYVSYTTGSILEAYRIGTELEKIVEKTPPYGNLTAHLTVARGALYCAADQYIYPFNPETLQGGDVITIKGDVQKLSSVVPYGDYLYFTCQSGVYRTDFEGNSEQILEGTDYKALTVSGEALYCVKGTSVLGLNVTEEGAAFTGYEICGSSASENRLQSGVTSVRADDLLVTADHGRVTVYNYSTQSYSSIICDYDPTLVATDGDVIAVSDGFKTIDIYDREGELSFRNRATETTVTGLACVFGVCYYTTGNSGFGIADEQNTKPIYRSGMTPSALTCDIYGNLYAVSGNDIYRYTEEEFTQASAVGEKLAIRFEGNAASFRSDFEGNLYWLNGSTLYKNGSVTAQIDASECVYRKSISDPLSFALGFEDSEVYFLYDNFMIKTDALEIPALDAIATGDATGEIFSPQKPLTLVTVENGAVGIRTDLDTLKTENSEYFPYQTYFRTEESARGILLAETEEYALVSLFGKNHKYTANLFNKTRSSCTVVPEEEYWQEENKTMYITNETALCLFPCLVSALRGETLPRACEVTVLGTVSAGETSDYDYAYVEYAGGASRSAIRGYLPLSYLTSASPYRQAEEYSLAWLKESEDGILFTAADGDTKLITERTQIELFETENGLLARLHIEGKDYTAPITENMIEHSISDALRISLIVGLSVLALLIIGGYFYLLPRKNEKKNAPHV